MSDRQVGRVKRASSLVRPCNKFDRSPTSWLEGPLLVDNLCASLQKGNDTRGIMRDPVRRVMSRSDFRFALPTHVLGRYLDVEGSADFLSSMPPQFYRTEQ